MTIAIKSHKVYDKKVKTTTSLSLDDKIILFREYMQTTGNTLDIHTTFKGFPIGIMANQARSKYLQGKANYTSTQIDALNELGLLDRRLESIEDKVKRLEKYCEKNLNIWHLRTVFLRDYLKKDLDEVAGGADIPEEMMEQFLDDYKIFPKLIEQDVVSGEIPILLVVKEFKKVLTDFSYVRTRSSHNKLADKYFKRLKDAGVSGIFGYSTEIEELSEKSGIEPERLQKIILDFGSLKNFRKIYIRFLLTWEPYKQENLLSLNKTDLNNQYIRQIFGSLERFNAFKKHFRYLAKINKVVTFFDLDEAGFIPSEENRTLAYIVGIEEILGTFLNKKALEERKAKLTSNETKVISELVETKGNKSLKDFGQELSVSRTRVMQIRDSAIQKLMRENANRVWELGRNNTRRKRFIQRYFEEKDIFITSESFILDDVLKRDLIRILGIDFERLLNNGEITSEEDVSKVLNMELTQVIVALQTAYDELSEIEANSEDELKPYELTQYELTQHELEQESDDDITHIELNSSIKTKER